MIITNYVKPMRQVKDMIREPYAFPGGYEKIAICQDGGVLCHQCVKDEYSRIVHDTVRGWRTGWDVAGVDIIQQTGTEHELTEWGDDVLYCDNCSKPLNLEQ